MKYTREQIETAVKAKGYAWFEGAKDYDVNLKDLLEPEFINLIPVFEYISYNNIELYDFTKIDVADLDVTKNSDLERFVLTHVYYITQKI